MRGPTVRGAEVNLTWVFFFAVVKDHMGALGLDE